MSDDLTDTLKGIKLTAKGKQPIKESEYIPMGDKADSLADPARSSIIHILRRGIDDKITEEHYDETTGTRTIIEKHVVRNALSVSEIVRLSEDTTPEITPLTKSQVYHHLPILIDLGYVIKYGTVRTGKRVTDYFKRVAKIFIFNILPGVTQKQKNDNVTKSINEIIERFGFTISDADREELIQLGIKILDIETKGYSTLLKRATGDLANKDVQNLAHELQSIYNVGVEDWIKWRKRMNEILFGK